ncbi:MAG: metal ABC transporter substrate-binding protein [Trueperaceae bacterium]
MLARLILTGLALLGGGCAMAQLRVVTSIAPYGDLVAQLTGELAEVSVLLPAGASPHTFEPTPRDAVQLMDADLVVLNGGIDEWLHEMVVAVNAQVPLLEALDVLAPALSASVEDEHDEEEHDGEDHDEEEHDEEEHSEGADPAHEHLHTGVNPHVWLDPLLVIDVVVAVADTLAQLDPANAATYQARAQVLTADLKALDAQLRDTLAPVAGAPFIPLHDAWPYFTQRYDLDLVMEIEPFPGREPSPRYLATVVATIAESGAPAIFSEAGLSDRPARVLAEEAGVGLFELDPLGRAGESYQDLLRRNTATVLEALSPWNSAP